MRNADQASQWRSRVRRLAIVGTLAGSVVALAPGRADAEPVVGGQLFSGGECEIKITVQAATAGYTSSLLVYLDDGSLFHDPGVTNFDVGEERTFTGPPAGEELVFGIYVHPTGDTFKMGPASRNPDDLIHAAVNDNGDDTFTVGFEDLLGGGDYDLDDNVFVFEGCIQPIVATDDDASTNQGVPVDVSVLDNDGGAGTLAVIDVGTPGNGSASANDDGTISYTPDAGFCGEDSFTYTIEDDFEQTASATVTVDVNCAPECSAAAPSTAKLWPPNHKFVPVSVEGITDADEDATTVTITSIFQDEPVNDAADGNTAPDGQGVGTDTAEVRAERSGQGDGRVYVIGFTASDGDGATCDGTVAVGVPHDKGGKSVPVNSGATYDSTVA